MFRFTFPLIPPALPSEGSLFSPERRKQKVPQKNPDEVPSKPNSRARRCGPCDGRAALSESPQLQAENLAPEGPAPLPTYLRAVGYSRLAKKQREGPCPARPKRECSAYRGQHSVDSACRAKKQSPRLLPLLVLFTCNLSNQWDAQGGGWRPAPGDRRQPSPPAGAVAGPIGNVGGECREARKRGKPAPN